MGFSQALHTRCSPAERRAPKAKRRLKLSTNNCQLLLTTSPPPDCASPAHPGRLPSFASSRELLQTAPGTPWFPADARSAFGLMSQCASAWRRPSHEDRLLTFALAVDCRGYACEPLALFESLDLDCHGVGNFLSSID